MNERSILETGTVDVIAVTDDLWSVRTLIVNVCFVGAGKNGEWVLIDTGIGPFTNALIQEAEQRFHRPPVCIILTHGHFDHVGSVLELADRWKVPVYAHAAELPYLTGKQDYPPADPSVGGGIMAGVSPLYPHQAIDLGERVNTLPADGHVPGLPEWRWIATPGHSPGHISLYRERDGCLIAGDAFITVKQESVLAVLSQKIELHGPPMYFTTDWEEARESVQALAALSPKTAVTGHGQPISGEELRLGLQRLADHFDEVAVPQKGKYVD